MSFSIMSEIKTLDSENLEKLDFRSVRYKKKTRYGDNDEIISELEDI